MDGVQTLLIIVVVALTMLLLVVGIQVFLIIIDLRKALRKLNGILEDSLIGGGLIKPDKLTGILSMFKRKKNTEKLGDGDFHQ